MAGKVKDLLEALEVKLAANPASPFFVGRSLTIADLQVSSNLKQNFG